ncbi:MAG: type IV secretory system conjugative DNA transfer family protein [Pseudomonadota bacterium]
MDVLKHFPRGLPSNQNGGFPDAAWCAPDKLLLSEKWQMRPGAVLVGRLMPMSPESKAHFDIDDGAYAPIAIQDDRHMMTVAGSRSGKGRSVIVPNMCLYPGSVIAIDPKGDLATITAARRGRGSETAVAMNTRVFVLDPFETVRGNAKDYLASFNPLDMIDPDGLYGRDDAALLADALIIPSQSDSHWTDAAKMLLTGLILHVCASANGEMRNLINVRAALTADEDGFADILAEMSLSDTAGGVVARSANSLLAMSDKERSSVLSTAIVQTDFLDSPAMQNVLARSDFTLSSLKDTPTTVYLSLPAGRIGTHSRWLRLMIALAIEAMERNRMRPRHPVLFLMDEFHALGPMKTIERAAGLIAGFGVRLWPILQDLTQLKRDYKDSWETFLGNAGLTQWFGVNDLTTLEYLSKRLGQTTLNVDNQGEISKAQAMNGFTGRSVSRQIVELMTPEEIGRYFSRQSGRQLVLWPGSDPIAIARLNYDESPALTGKFDPDPNYCSTAASEEFGESSSPDPRPRSRNRSRNVRPADGRVQSESETRHAGAPVEANRCRRRREPSLHGVSATLQKATGMGERT